jgi:hypothetical protein
MSGLCGEVYKHKSAETTKQRGARREKTHRPKPEEQEGMPQYQHCPGVGCARRPVGTYLYLHAVGGGNPVAVLCLARQGAERGTDNCDPRDH